MNKNRLILHYCATFFILFILTVVGFSLEGNYYKKFIAESGLIETLTVIGYLLCLLIIIFKGRADFLKKYFYLAALPLLMGLRELDFDKRFTTMGIFKSRFFPSLQVPAAEKIFAILTVLILASLAAIILKRHLIDFFKGLRERSPVAIGTGLTMGLMVTAKLLDGLERKANIISVSLQPTIIKLANVAEEVLELGIPIIMLLTFNYYLDQKKNNNI